MVLRESVLGVTVLRGLYWGDGREGSVLKGDYPEESVIGKVVCSEGFVLGRGDGPEGSVLKNDHPEGSVLERNDCPEGSVMGRGDCPEKSVLVKVVCPEGLYWGWWMS